MKPLIGRSQRSTGGTVLILVQFTFPEKEEGISPAYSAVPQGAKRPLPKFQHV